MSPRREKTDTTMFPEHTTDGVLLSNPRADPGYHSVPKLLRRTADHLDEELGEGVTVRDLLLEWKDYLDPQTYEFDEEQGPGLNVYWPDRRETKPPDPMNYFSTTNPEDGTGHRAPNLLRRVADHLDELGDNVIVHELMLHIEPTGEGLAPSANTYYTRPTLEDGRAQNSDPANRELLLDRERYADSQTHEPGEEQKTAMSEPMNYFSMTNPEKGSDRFSVPKLLRLVADRIDELGDDVIVNDLILHIEVTSEGYLPSINVYYYYEKGE
jgi:hypothetical protein